MNAPVMRNLRGVRWSRTDGATPAPAGPACGSQRRAMIVIVAFLFGVALGVGVAWRKQGDRLDMAQYGAIFGIGFAVLGVFLTVALERML